MTRRRIPPAGRLAIFLGAPVVLAVAIWFAAYAMGFHALRKAVRSARELCWVAGPTAEVSADPEVNGYFAMEATAERLSRGLGTDYKVLRYWPPTEKDRAVWLEAARSYRETHREDFDQLAAALGQPQLVAPVHGEGLDAEWPLDAPWDAERVLTLCARYAILMGDGVDACASLEQLSKLSRMRFQRPGLLALHVMQDVEQRFLASIEEGLSILEREQRETLATLLEQPLSMTFEDAWFAQRSVALVILEQGLEKPSRLDWLCPWDLNGWRWLARPLVLRAAARDLRWHAEAGSAMDSAGLAGLEELLARKQPQGHRWMWSQESYYRPFLRKLYEVESARQQLIRRLRGWEPSPDLEPPERE